MPHFMKRELLSPEEALTGFPAGKPAAPGPRLGTSFESFVGAGAPVVLANAIAAASREPRRLISWTPITLKAEVGNPGTRAAALLGNRGSTPTPPQSQGPKKVQQKNAVFFLYFWYNVGEVIFETLGLGRGGGRS
eukprot:6462256-Amphidinium_carterae.1